MPFYNFVWNSVVVLQLRWHRMHFSILQDSYMILLLLKASYCILSLSYIFCLSFIRESFVQYWKDSFFLLFLFLFIVWCVFSKYGGVVYVAWCMDVNVQCMHLCFPKQRWEQAAKCFPLLKSLLYFIFLQQSLSWNYKLVFLARQAARLLF